MGKKCKSKTKKGSRCKAWPVEGSDYCWAHAPSLAKKRSRAKSKGGRGRAYPKGKCPGKVSTIDDALAGVNATIQSAWVLDNTAERGRLLASLYDLSVRIVRPSEVEERLAALERSINEQAN